MHFGDGGYTKLHNKKVSKSNDIVSVLGDIDELTSALGVVRTASKSMQVISHVSVIQERLQKLASGFSVFSEEKSGILLDDNDVKKLDYIIGYIEDNITLPKDFIIPGKFESQAAAYLDVARAICRRLERNIVGLPYRHIHKNKPLLAWVNRLSTVLWYLARLEESK